MQTIQVKKRYALSLQSGDKAEIEMTVPDVLPLGGLTIRFQIRDKAGNLLVDKTSEGIAVTGQVITISFVRADTVKYSGQCDWEIKAYDGNGEPVTFGMGDMALIKTIIK
jgi:hypothetical protein